MKATGPNHILGTLCALLRAVGCLFYSTYYMPSTALGTEDDGQNPRLCFLLYLWDERREREKDTKPANQLYSSPGCLRLPGCSGNFKGADTGRAEESGELRQGKKAALVGAADTEERTQRTQGSKGSGVSGNTEQVQLG